MKINISLCSENVMIFYVSIVEKSGSYKSAYCDMTFESWIDGARRNCLSRDNSWVNTILQQRINTQQWKNFRMVFFVWSDLRVYGKHKRN
jgi:hypothetical protein